MLRFAIFLFLLQTSFGLLGQSGTVTGTVTDSADGSPLPFANVFIDNTTIGTVTNEKGEFTLKDLPIEQINVAASFVGYRTSTQPLTIRPGKNFRITFKLDPLKNQLDEVSLTSRRDKKWERQLVRFEEIFLGSPYDAMVNKTKILNPWVLDFEEGKDESGSRYFAATANQVLEIENHALGYKIHYHLETFRQTRNGFTYQGPIRFTEMDTVFSNVAERWQENRQKVYFGSARHLFKSMIRGNLQKQGYELFYVKTFGLAQFRTNSFDQEKGNSLELLPPNTLATTSGTIGQFLLLSSKKLEIHYTREFWPNVYYSDVYYPVSWVVFKGGSTEVSGRGVPIDPSDVILSGHMAKARVAHMLPHNFAPEDSLRSSTQSPEEVLLAQQQYRIQGLREKPFLTTDKPYYYPGETVWLSGQMLYQNPIMADTLSRVVYVDLIDASGSTGGSLMLPVEAGKFTGQLTLPDSTAPGNYGLRAYTHWMRNFGPDEITYQPLPVLDLFETVENKIAIKDEMADPDLQVEISTSRAKYFTREKINLRIQVTDNDGAPLAAGFSLSVTDTLQVASVPLQPALTTAYDWVLKAKPASFAQTPGFPIEYGIGFGGQFLNRRDKPDTAAITIVQGEYEDYGIVKTDTLGQFWASGLHFEDSAQIAFGAIDAKGRPYGSVTLFERTPPEVKKALPTLNLQVRRKDSPQQVFRLPEEGGYTLLDEIVVEETAIEPMEERNYGYGPGDKVFTEEDFAKNPGLGVLGMLQQNLPGFSSGSQRLSRQNWGLSTAPPLVIIDGMKYSEPPGGTFLAESGFSYLNTILPGEIKKVTVYINSSHVFGLAGFSGVIMVETTRGDRIEDKKPPLFNKEGFSLYTLPGYAAEQPFASPDYSTPKESHAMPDTRATLFWAPFVTTDAATGQAEITFYAADIATNYRIVVEGMTEDNTPFKVVKYIQVVN